MIDLSFSGISSMRRIHQHNSKSIMPQIVFDSVNAFRVYDSGKFHKDSIQYLLPNMRDNKGIVPWNLFRTFHVAKVVDHFLRIFAEWIVDVVLPQICL